VSNSIHNLINAEFVRLLSAAGWSQAEAARRLYLDPGTISLYVNGKVRPSLTVLALFKCLIGDTQPLPGQEEPLLAAGRPLESWEFELLEGLRLLTPERRRRVSRCFQALLDELPREPAAETHDLQSAGVHPAVKDVVAVKAAVPEELTRVPGSAVGYKESLRRTQTKRKPHKAGEAKKG